MNIDNISSLSNLPANLRKDILAGIILKANQKGRSFEKQSQKNQQKIIKRVVKEKLLSNEMHGKFYQRKPNNPNGLLPSQYGYVRKSIYKLNPEKLAHIIREQEKRVS